MTETNELAFTATSLSNQTMVISTGEALNNVNAHQLVEIITTAQADGAKFVILDMTKLDFLSSAGVGSILGTVETCREVGGDIILCNVSEDIRNVLEILDLGDFLVVKDSVDDAVRHCGQSG